MKQVATQSVLLILLFFGFFQVSSGALLSPLAHAQSSKSLADFDAKLAHELVQKKGALLLDVRTAVEFSVGHIDGAKRVGVSELAEKIDQVKKMQGGDMQKPIVVYCQSGGRSARAKAILQKAGFKNVSNLGAKSNWYKAK